MHTVVDGTSGVVELGITQKDGSVLTRKVDVFELHDKLQKQTIPTSLTDAELSAIYEKVFNEYGFADFGSAIGAYMAATTVAALTVGILKKFDATLNALRGVE